MVGQPSKWDPSFYPSSKHYRRPHPTEGETFLFKDPTKGGANTLVIRALDYNFWCCHSGLISCPVTLSSKTLKPPRNCRGARVLSF